MKTEKLLILAAGVGGLILFMNASTKAAQKRLERLQTQYGAAWSDVPQKQDGTKSVSDLLSENYGIA